MSKNLYFSDVIKVIIIGTGNVAKHLFNAMHQSKGVEVVQVAGRNEKSLSYYSDYTNTKTGFENLNDADIYVMALSDDAIENTASVIASTNRFLVHTSGSTALCKLPEIGRRGVFYPLQTFSKEREVNFNEIPVCLEAENEDDYLLLENLAKKLTNNQYRINSQQRLQLHMAAVFVNNFTNHLFQIGHELCMDNDMSFELLKPLINETVRKIDTMNPYEAQTGPARRGDLLTMQTQLDSLKNHIHQDIYKLISESIQSTYAEKL